MPIREQGRGARPGTAAFRLDDLDRALGQLDASASAAQQLTRLRSLGLDRLPLPGAGATLTRWRALAAVAAHDLSLAKLYEGHTDALAILAELGGGTPEDDAPSPTETWGVWAAEVPGSRACIESEDADGTVRLGGAKAWCSGADGATHALLTAWHSDGDGDGVEAGPQLVRLALGQAGLVVDRSGWHAVGMAASASLTVRFAGAGAGARGRRVGAPGAYLARPGFWQGGAGVAACWYGGAAALARFLRHAVGESAPAGRSPFRMAALGKVDVALRAASALMREAAAWIDDHPREDAAEVALRLRLAVENAATAVLDEVGRALGATPYCRDPWFARMATDLPVFLRQSHAERDCAALGERLVASPGERLAAAHGPAAVAERPPSPGDASGWRL